MTEFPALRDALVGAATRRRRRRRWLSAAAPALAVAAAAMAVLALPREDERELAAPAARDALEQAFAVFRRPATKSDRLPDDLRSREPLERGRARFLGQIGPIRMFAVPANGQLCLIAYRHRRASTVSCLPDERATAETSLPVVRNRDWYAVLVPDTTRDVRFVGRDGSQGAGSIRDNALLALAPDGIGGLSWTGASGTRYIRRSTAPPQVTIPVACPRRLDPLPADAAARASRAALIAVDRLYPQAMRAEVTGATVAPGTPCSRAISQRSVEVELALVPRDPGQRSSASLSQGRLLVGMRDGSMRVYYLLH